MFIPFIAIPFALAFQGQTQPLTVQKALESARTNRPAVQAAEARLSAALLTRRGLGASPATRLFLGYTSDAAVGGSDDDAVLVQPIDLFGRTAASRSLGDAQVMQAEAQYRGTLLNIQTEVLEAYAEAAASAELASTSAQTLELAQRLTESTRRRVEEGILPGIQLTRVGVELERARLMARQREASRVAALRRLSGTLGIGVEGLAVSGFADLGVEATDDALLQTLRPELLELASDVKIAEAEARVAKSDLAPELEIQARRTAWQVPETRYGARIQLALPIFDHGRSRAETAAAKSRAAAARRALQDATQLAQAEIDASVVELNSAREQVAGFQAIVLEARKLVESQRVGLLEGASTLIEVLEANRTLRETEEALVEARLTLALAQARAIRARGRLVLEDNK